MIIGVRTLPVLALVAACASRGPQARFEHQMYRRGDIAFHVGALPAPWRRIDAPDGALAWTHTKRDAVIATNAVCHGHHDPPLGVLANDLLIGTTARRVLLDETIPFDEREARHEVVEAKQDGVPMVYDLYVMKKDGCVYDLSLVASPRSYDAVADQFVGFVAGFHGVGEAR